MRRAGRHVPLNVDVDLFEDISERTLQVRRLYDRIHRLGLVDRALILLWLEGLSYEEIGAVMGISVKNVSFQLHRIKELLKKMKIINKHYAERGKYEFNGTGTVAVGVCRFEENAG